MELREGGREGGREGALALARKERRGGGREGGRDWYVPGRLSIPAEDARYLARLVRRAVFVG